MARTVVAALLTALLVAGIVSGVVLMPRVAGTNIEIYAKDDPAPWQHLNVTFSTLEVQKADGGWTNLTLSAKTVDFMALRNVSQLLGSAHLADGRYTQIRVVVASATGVTLEGQPVQFTVPSGELKVVRPFNLTATSRFHLTLDFDLTNIHPTGQGKWILNPVVASVE